MKLEPIHAPPLDEAKQISHVAAFPGTYHLKASPGTDLWLKPPDWKVENMPCYVVNIPVANFHSARATMKAKWGQQYDQGGLVLFLPEWQSHSLWVKTGVEFVDGKPYVSTVGARHAADWSLFPMPAGGTGVTIEIEREEVNEAKGTGTSLWVYLVEGEERKAIRELTWVFKEKGDVSGTISVGIYAARPAKDGLSDEDCLEVEFDGFRIR